MVFTLHHQVSHGIRHCNLFLNHKFIIVPLLVAHPPPLATHPLSCLLPLSNSHITPRPDPANRGPLLQTPAVQSPVISTHQRPQQHASSHSTIPHHQTSTTSTRTQPVQPPHGKFLPGLILNSLLMFHYIVIEIELDDDSDDGYPTPSNPIVYYPSRPPPASRSSAVFSYTPLLAPQHHYNMPNISSFSFPKTVVNYLEELDVGPHTLHKIDQARCYKSWT